MSRLRFSFSVSICSLCCTKFVFNSSMRSICTATFAVFRLEIAVIQVGADNPYGHPTPETIDRLRRFGARVFRNDEDGDVIVTIKDQEAKVAVTKP